MTSDPRNNHRGLTLDLDAETIRSLGYRIVDIIVEELNNPSHRPAFPPATHGEAMEAVFGGPTPQEGTEPHELLRIIKDDLLPAAANLNHPRLMAYVLSASAPLAGLIGGLTATLKLGPRTWDSQPACGQIELTVVRWLGEMVGFCHNAAGCTTTGGSWANLVGLAIARQRHAGWDVRADGLAGRPALTAYVSDQGHCCLAKSMELMGLGSDMLRKIPVGPDFTVRLDLLEQAIKADREAGRIPFCLIGNAGTTNTGAIDPLNDMADIAARHNLWFHVDGAYGALAALVSSVRSKFVGMERADSLVVDPHKWLNMPFDTGCILTRNWHDLTDTFSLIPSYLHASTTGPEHNHLRYGFELGRTDRALKVWLALRQYGIKQYTQIIANHLALTRFFAASVRQSNDFEVISDPTLSVCCFRFVPPDLRDRSRQVQAYLNQLNQALETALACNGQALLSGTQLNGKRVLRMCIVSHRVTQASVEQTLRLLRDIGRELDTDLRR